MKRILTSWHTWIAAALFATFWTSAYFIPNNVVLLVTNSLVLSASAAVGVAYMPVALHAIAKDEASRVQRIALGICYAWVFSSLWRVWSLLWLTSGQEPWMVNNDVIAFFQAGIALAAGYHLVSPGAIGGSRCVDMPSLKWIALGIVAGAAVGLAALLAFFNPDTTAFVHWMKPYVPR